MKTIYFFFGLTIFFCLDHLLTTQPNGLNPITAHQHIKKSKNKHIINYDSLGYSGADTAVYESIISDRKEEKGGGK